MMYDFSSCLFDLGLVPKGKEVVEHYPELDNYEEIQRASDLEVRVAFALADMNSPFLQVRDNTIRVKNIMDWCGCKDKAFAEKVMDWSHESVSAVASVYLFMQNNHDFTMWWNMNQLFYSLMTEMGKPKENKDDVDDYVKRKLSIQKQSNSIKNDLKAMEAELFSDTKMKMAIVRQKMSKVRTYAEMYADANQVE